MFAHSVMDTNFHCLFKDQTIVEAIQMFESASIKENRKVFGMMVTDSQDQLVGMLSMYDILLYIQPKHIQILGEMDDLTYEPIFEGLLSRVKKIRVGDIMSTDLVTVKPETHLMVVVDIMIRKHILRLPVVKAGRVTGIIYRSNVFDHLMKKLME